MWPLNLLIYLIIDPDFRQSLQSQPRHSDIQHGRMYRRLSKPGGFLCKRTNPYNISFLLNTDGVSLYKSSASSFWPVFLIINELSPSKRFVTLFIT